LAVRHAFGDHHVDIAAGRKPQALLGLACHLLQRDGENRLDVIALLGLGASTFLALGAGPESIAEKLREDILGGVGAARAAPATEGTAPGAEVEIREIVLARAASPTAEAFESLKAGLSIRVDLAAVELRPLVLVADDFVSRIQLRELVLSLRVVLVAVGMMDLGKLG